MAFGQVIKGKTLGSFGQNQFPSIAAGISALYSLDFFSTDSYLGAPFYHFSSDWDRAGGTINFQAFSDGGHLAQEARVGNLVSKWKNMYLAPDQGDAVSFSTTAPMLVEKTYSGRPYRGLEFTGNEYFQIDGATVANNYSPPAPIFSTGGSPWAGNKGATFMFVIDSSEDIAATPNAGATQALLYSRQPSTSNGEIVPVTWPTTEDYGIQFFRNLRQNTGSIGGTELAVGPQGTVQGANILTSNGLARSPIIDPQGFGGAEMVNIPNDQEGDRLEPGGGLDFKARWTNSGFQVILLEYDNVNQVKHQDAPGFGADRAYEGPQVKIYGMSNPNNPIDQGGFSLPWNGHDLTVPKLTFTNPMLRDHTLFDKAHAFLGGVPNYRLQAPWNNPLAHGFRGIMYEVMMLEGILSTADKSTLQRELLRKYRGAL